MNKLSTPDIHQLLTCKLFFTALLLFCPPLIADNIIIAVRAHSGIEAGIKHWEPTIKYLQQKTPQHQFALLPVEGIAEMEHLFSSGEIDFVITQPVAYVDLERNYGATRILTLIKKGGLAQFGSVIFSREGDQEAENFKQLETKTIAAVTKKGFGGWLIGYKELLDLGINANTAFKQVIFSGTHEAVVKDVISGKADIGIIRTGIIEQMLNNKQLSPNSIHIINPQKNPRFPLMLSTTLYPEWAFAKSSNVSAKLAANIVTHLLAMESNNLAAVSAGYEGWTVPLSYNSVHDLMKQLKVGSYANENHFEITEILKQNSRAVFAFFIFFIVVLGFIILIFYQKNKALIKLSIALEKTRLKLESSEEQSFTTLNSIGDAVISTDLNSRVTYINPVAEKITGWKKDEAIGQPLNTIIQFIDKVTQDTVTNPVTQCLAKMQVVNLSTHTLLKTREGKEIEVEDSAAPIKNRQQKTTGAVLVFHDVTESKKLELELNYQAQETLQLWALIENSINEVYIFDEYFHFLHVNKSARKNLGYSKQELGEKTALNILPEINKSHFEKLLTPLIKGITQVKNFSTNFQRKDGTTYPVDVYLQYTHYKDQPVFVAFALDISLRRSTEEQLQRAQKMDAIGQMAGGIAHDYNNILGIVIGNLSFLKRLVADDDKALKRVKTADKAAQRAVDLTRQLLGFSREQAQQVQATDINLVIQGMDSLISRSVTPEVEIEQHFADDLWLTDIDPADFEDALLNLILNARDTMPGAGKLTIETCNKMLDSAYTEKNPSITAGDYVELTINDTGRGISEDDQARIFEPFFTTKPRGKGTGLGLSMVFGFIQRSKGHIKVYSELGIGTTFRCYLPRSFSNAEVLQGSPPERRHLPQGEETILVVDDELDLLELGKQYLEDLGYTVLTATNGQHALSVLTKETPIDLLFSDVVMPGGMNGYELAEQATALNPQLRVLLTSGYTSKILYRNGQARFKASLLNKPYNQQEIATRVRLVLDEYKQ